MLITWQPSKFALRPPVNVQLPDGTIETKFYLTDAPKIMKAREMVL